MEEKKKNLPGNTPTPICSFKKDLQAYKLRIKRRIKTLKKALNKTKDHLQKCQSYPQFEKDTILLQSQIFTLKPKIHTIEISDWETGEKKVFHLDPYLKPEDEIAKRYKTIKKWKKGLPFTENRLDQIQKDLKKEECLLEEILQIETEKGFNQFLENQGLKKFQKRQQGQKEIKESKPYREFLSSKNIPIWVGKNAADNDKLTFSLGNGNDLWMHVASYSGSHVLIRLKKEQECDPETFSEALQLSLHYSKASHLGEAEIAVTRVKYVKRFGKEKGKVQLAEEKKYFIKKDAAILKKLQTHS